MSSEEAEREREERKRKLQELKDKADVLLDFTTPLITESTVIEVQKHPLRDDKSDQHIPFLLCGRSFILRISNGPAVMAVTLMNGDPFTSFSADFGMLIMDWEGTELVEDSDCMDFVCGTDPMDLLEWHLNGGIKDLEYLAVLCLDKKALKVPPHEDYTSFRVKVTITCQTSYSNTRVTYNAHPSIPSICESVDSQARWQTGPTDGQEGSVFITCRRQIGEIYDRCKFILWGRAYDVFHDRSLFKIRNGSRTESKIKWSCTFYDHEGLELHHCDSNGERPWGVVDPEKSRWKQGYSCEFKFSNHFCQHGDAIQRELMHALVTITEYTPFLMQSSAATAPEAPSRSLDADMLGLFESGRSADVTFVVEGQSVQAHRAMLVARCPVPIAHEEMAEGKPGAEIVITDVSAPVFRAFLRYLYSDSVTEQDLENLSLGLLRVAHKYGLEDLERICNHYLLRNICASDVWDTLLVAKELEMKALVRSCQLLITAKTAEVLKSDGYRESNRDDPDNAAKLLEECLSSTDTRQTNQQNEKLSGQKRRCTW